MATKEFGSSTEAQPDYIAQLYSVAGVKFPVQVESVQGKLVRVSYETVWKEGNTTPVETGDADENGNPVIEYKENYTNKKLTTAQTKKIDAWIKENLAE